MKVEHKKAFGVYHWDTFDNETFLVGEADTLPEAEQMVESKYGSRISFNGADKVEIVSKTGEVLGEWQVK